MLTYMGFTQIIDYNKNCPTHGRLRDVSSWQALSSNQWTPQGAPRQTNKHSNYYYIENIKYKTKQLYGETT